MAPRAALNRGPSPTRCAGDVVDEWILVSEQEIAEALRLAKDTEYTLIEGAAGVALAAGMRYGTEHPGQTIVVVSCGGNISARTNWWRHSGVSRTRRRVDQVGTDGSARQGFVRGCEEDPPCPDRETTCPPSGRSR